MEDPLSALGELGIVVEGQAKARISESQVHRQRACDALPDLGTLLKKKTRRRVRFRPSFEARRLARPGTSFRPSAEEVARVKPVRALAPPYRANRQARSARSMYKMDTNASLGGWDIAFQVNESVIAAIYRDFFTVSFAAFPFWLLGGNDPGAFPGAPPVYTYIGVFLLFLKLRVVLAFDADSDGATVAMPKHLPTVSFVENDSAHVRLGMTGNAKMWLAGIGSDEWGSPVAEFRFTATQTGTIEPRTEGTFFGQAMTNFYVARLDDADGLTITLSPGSILEAIMSNMDDDSDRPPPDFGPNGPIALMIRLGVAGYLAKHLPEIPIMFPVQETSDPLERFDRSSVSTLDRSGTPSVDAITLAFGDQSGPFQDFIVPDAPAGSLLPNNFAVGISRAAFLYQALRQIVTPMHLEDKTQLNHLHVDLEDGYISVTGDGTKIDAIFGLDVDFDFEAQITLFFQDLSVLVAKVDSLDIDVSIWWYVAAVLVGALVGGLIGGGAGAVVGGAAGLLVGSAIGASAGGLTGIILAFAARQK